MYTHKRHSHALSNWRVRANISEKFILTNISLYIVAEDRAVRMCRVHSEGGAGASKTRNIIYLCWSSIH